MANPIMNPKLYAKITGIALAAVAVLGLVLSLANDGKFIENFLMFDLTHDIVHVVLAAVALYVGFAATNAMARMYAQAFGIVYLALGVVGFFWTGVQEATTTTMGILGLELGENLVHLVIGAWGVVAGFFGAKDTMATGTTSMRA